MKRRWLILAGLLLAGGSAIGLLALPSRTTYAWVYLEDKGDLSRYQPQAFLSQAALARRQAQGIALTASDYPVKQRYLAQLSELASTRVLGSSKWLNAAFVRCEASQKEALRQLPFVRKVSMAEQRKFEYRRPIEPPASGIAGQARAAPTDTSEADSAWLGQLALHKARRLHAKGYKGQGVRIAVFDNGFAGIDTVPGLKHLVAEGRVKATYDWVANEQDVYDEGHHGTEILSLMAGRRPGHQMGIAPEAQFLLAHTENSSQETIQEEFNWVQAAEWADSAGAQVFQTSLGYYDFDDSTANHPYSALDGNTTPISRAADAAARKGILVVNSAGNEGMSDWKHIVPPADADSILSVGGVGLDSSWAFFSSIGPTVDGRIKPEVCGMGVFPRTITAGGDIGGSVGTSYSSPLVAGLAACVSSAFPADQQPGGAQLLTHLIGASHQRLDPTNKRGYGIPNGMLALKLLQARRQLASPRPVFRIHLPRAADSAAYWLGISRRWVDKRLIIDFLNGSTDVAERLYFDEKHLHPAQSYVYVPVPQSLAARTKLRIKNRQFGSVRFKGNYDEIPIVRP